jgi:TRAP-type C4-dicarboxylate transport system permease large subunit
VIAAAGPFSWLLAKLGTLNAVETWLLGFASTPFLFVAVLLLFIILTGMVMDAVANIVILGPMLVGVCAAAGFHEIQAALVIVVGFLLGTVTPPVGVSYFTAAHIAGASLEKVAVELVPFIAIEVVVLLLLFMVPALTVWLPSAAGFVE